MDFADRFILESSFIKHGGPSNLEQVIDDLYGWAENQQISLHEIFHENTKYCSFNFTQQIERIISLAKQINPYYSNSKNFDGFPWIDLLELQPAANYPKQVTKDNDLASVDCLSKISSCLHFARYGNTMSSIDEKKQEQGEQAPYSMANLYAIDLYVISLSDFNLKAGSYYYHPFLHRLYAVVYEDFKEMFSQKSILEITPIDTSILVVCVGAFKRATWCFGDRGYRNILLEAGIVVERLCSAAAKHGLKNKCISNFVDDAVNKLIRINGTDESTLFLVELVI
jgi:SagB-type dehydrogenase family enzyme